MVPLFRERRCIMSAGFYHQTGIAAIKKYITIKWQGASKHNEYMKNFMRTEVLVSGVE